jgi:hypothetical protein
MKKIALLALGLLLLGGISSPPGTAQDADGLKRLMISKLKNSQAVLEGLALNDFTKISRGAEHLIQISKTAEWSVRKTAKYELFSNEFRRAAATIVEKARDKNLDGAALAYFDMTMTCLRCHRYMRKERDAQRPAPAADLAATAETNFRLAPTPPSERIRP